MESFRHLKPHNDNLSFEFALPASASTQHYSKLLSSQANCTMVQLASILAAVTLTTATFVDAHPGQPHHHRSLREMAELRSFKQNAHRSLAACANSQSSRQLQKQAASLRDAKVRALRESRRRLAAADVLAKSHKSSLTDVSSKTDVATLFGATPTCILEPEVTQGPYYVKGELIRSDIRESQAGVDLYAEIQVIDVNTCEPVADLYLDFWHCNSTGVYAGVVANGNGNQNDLTNLDTTFHRGLASTNDDGVVQFTTKFPGHYTGRASHIHVLGNHGGQVLDNNTYAGSTVTSVGQLFFDQSLISAVEATGSYVTNKQKLTTNAADSIFAQETATGFDPVMQYVYLGDSVEDGIFAWVTIGIDATISKSVSAAATYTADGGVANSNAAGGGGMGGGSGMGPPSGSFGGGSGMAPPNGSFGGPGSDGSDAFTATPSPTTTAAVATTPKPACK